VCGDQLKPDIRCGTIFYAIAVAVRVRIPRASTRRRIKGYILLVYYDQLLRRRLSSRSSVRGFLSCPSERRSERGDVTYLPVVCGRRLYPYQYGLPAITMGLLFSKIWSYFGTEEHKIVIIGLDNAGKTTILYQFLMNEVVHTSPTIGSNVEEVIWNNIHFIMWDLGGQQSLRAAWSTYYCNTEFVIVVIDSTDRSRLDLSREELYKVLNNEELSSAAVLVYANKQDMKGALTAAEISKHLNLTSIKKQQWHIQACCALTGEGLYQGLEWICSQLKNK